MTEIPQNRRRSRSLQRLSVAWKAFSRGWDLHLFLIGYGTLFGFLGIGALWLPDVPPPAVEADLPMMPGGAPGTDHWFGLNHQGDDMMIPVLRGSGISVWLALLATVAGTAAGLAAGTVFYFLWRERGSRMLGAFSQWIASLPAMLTALGLAAGWGTGFWSLAIILGGLCAIPVAARVSSWYREMEGRGDVLAARAAGWTRAGLMADAFRTRIWQRTGATAAMLLPGVLLAEATLGYVFESTGRLGDLLADGQPHLIDAPWLFFFPGLILSVLTILMSAMAWAVRRTVREPLHERFW